VNKNNQGRSVSVSSACYTGIWSLVFGYPETLRDTGGQWLPLRRLSFQIPATHFEKAWAGLPWAIHKLLFDNTMVSPNSAVEIVHTLKEQRPGVILELNPEVFQVPNWQDQVTCPICFDPAHAFWEVRSSDRPDIMAFVRQQMKMGNLAVIHVQCSRTDPQDFAEFLQKTGKTYDLLEICAKSPDFNGHCIIENTVYHTMPGWWPQILRNIGMFFSTHAAQQSVVRRSFAITKELFQIGDQR
jgi:hypothetical protein